MTKQHHEPAPERAALAAAIEAAATRSSEIAALEKAVAAARVSYSDAQDRRRTAAAAIEPARAAATEHAIALALGTAGDAPISVRAATAALTEAEDAEAAAKAALDTLRERLAGKREFEYLVAEKLKLAAGAALRPGTAGLLADVQRLQRELFDKGSALQWLESVGALDLEPDAVTGASAPAALIVDRCRSPMTTWGELANDPTIAGAAPWQAAFDRLLSDANAELPK